MSAPRRTSPPLEAVTDAVLTASRALVAVASRSIAAVDGDVTLPQFRALVVLDQRGQCNVSDLARELRIQPSTATRLCDRLVQKRLIRRAVATTSRREVTLSLTGAGRTIVRKVTTRRRREIATIMEKVPAAQRAAIVEALTAFCAAAGEERAVPAAPW